MIRPYVVVGEGVHFCRATFTYEQAGEARAIVQRFVGRQKCRETYRAMEITLQRWIDGLVDKGDLRYDHYDNRWIPSVRY